MNHVLLIAGQQIIAKQGEKKFVPHLDGKIGDTLELEGAVLASFGVESIDLTADNTPKKAVVKIENQVRGDKVIAFKKKRRKGFAKKRGHRTHYTQISLQNIV